MSAPALYALCATGNGLDTLAAVAGEIPLAGVVGLSERPRSDAVSGLVHCGAFCRRHGLDLIEVDGYALDKDADRDRLTARPMDLLLVLGWQRLVPEWLLRHSRHGGVGVHGSARGIAGGRGRSPQNWAIMAGCPSFEVSLFRLEPGVDSGRVLASRRFPLTRLDDIASSHLKVSLSSAAMLAQCWRDGSLLDDTAGTAQAGTPRYLPQRKPEDGAIDWSRPAAFIHDFVRALTRPYPGAFSPWAGGVVKVWRGRPLDLGDDPPTLPPGTIVGRPTHGGLLIAAADGLFLADEWEGDGDRDPQPGDRLASVSFADGMAAINRRFRRAHPGLQLAEDALLLAGEGS